MTPTHPVLVLPPATRFGKRALDVVGSGAGLLVLGPVIGLSALAVRLESPGPAFFRQVRVGLGGRPFTIVKLRGMYVDAEERFAELYAYETRTDLHFHFRDSDDPRITKVGRWLRRTSLDELPNLWNVLRGEMSIVGPRPEIPELSHLYGELAAPYLSVRPGLTCLAAYLGRDDLTKAERVALDATYCENVSVRGDLLIVLRTLGALLRGFGVRV